jgi:trans-2,3-dihydro-3-hydroxyanthranilate isomerase
VTLRFYHVDVFAPQPYRGNSLAVFPDATGLTRAQMALITTELRHFESIFLDRDTRFGCAARVFDLHEELPFAGHPLIGAAAVLHLLSGSQADQRWTIRLAAGPVEVRTERRGPDRYASVLDQGAPTFVGVPDEESAPELASWFDLDPSDLDPNHRPEVVSIGLRYLVLPVRASGLARARIVISDLEVRLARIGAQFAYLLDVANLEGRHWNNDGVVEDVATGSGAGCAAAYLRRHGVIPDGGVATLSQGRFTGRPSQITIRVYGDGADIGSVEVGGDVSVVGGGYLDVLPD